MKSLETTKNIYLFDRKMTGWVLDYNKGTATYNIHDAALFPADFDYCKDRYAAHDESHSEGFGDFEMKVVYDDFNIGFRGKYKIPVIQKANPFLNYFEEEGYTLIETKKTLAYRMSSSSEWEVFDDMPTLLSHARKEAISSLTSSGYHYHSIYSAYVNFLNGDHGFDLSGYTDDHLVKDRNENPMFKLQKGTPVIGTEFHFSNDEEKAQYRADLETSLHQFCHTDGFDFRGYTARVKPVDSPREDYLEQAKECLSLFDNAYRIEVCGFKKEGDTTRLYLLFRGDTDKGERVLIPNKAFVEDKNGIVTKQDFIDYKPRDMDQDYFKSFNKQIVKQMITEARYPDGINRTKGKLSDSIKSRIRSASHAFALSDEYTVSSVMPSNTNSIRLLGRSELGGVPCASSGLMLEAGLSFGNKEVFTSPYPLSIFLY